MDLLASLRRLLGDRHVLVPPPERLTTDWMGRRGGRLVAAVRPGNTEESAAVVRACAELGVGVIPVGGNTGLVGGTLAPGEGDRAMLALCTERLVGVDFDPESATLLADAGVTIADAHVAAAAAGLTFGVDFAARDSATVGGAISTNAGGIRVCAYGPMRRQVLGIEAVLGDGSVVTDLAGLPKDNTGFDLRDLLVGSEGCLAVVTRARLALHRPPLRLLTVALGQPSLSAALATARILGTCGRTMAAEIVDARSWTQAAAGLQLRDPLRLEPVGYALLVELAEVDDERLARALADGPDAVVAQHPGDRAVLWQLRERQSEWWSVRTRSGGGTVLHKFDVTVPLGALDTTVAELRQVTEVWPSTAGFGIFGHLLEGSLHIQVLALPGRSEGPRRMLATVAAAGGSISAEHGIGRDKAALLSLRRSPAEIDAMRRVKHALDPAGIMNPGAVLP